MTIRQINRCTGMRFFLCINSSCTIFLAYGILLLVLVLIAVIKSLIPSRWTVIIILGLSVLQDLTYGPLGIMHDSLSSKLAQGHVGLPHDDDVNIVENLTRKSILLHILSEIYNFLLVFIVVIVTPIFVSTTFGQLSRQQIRQLGNSHSLITHS